MQRGCLFNALMAVVLLGYGVNARGIAKTMEATRTRGGDGGGFV